MQFLNFAFLFNCQVEFLNLCQNYEKEKRMRGLKIQSKNLFLHEKSSQLFEFRSSY